jgi:hypothetical protein
MSSVQLMDCTLATTISLERVNFFNRQLLTADDMNTERDYFLQKLRRHNRFMHGWGVVCGLSVTAAPISGTPWRVQIGSGYALGPYGDEIFVAEAVYFDLAACLSGGATNPCEPNMLLPGAAGSSTTVYLGIQYAECLARPVQVANSGCGCDDDPCQYSRICDSFQIQCLPQLTDQPPLSQLLCENIASGAIPPCPPCPTNPWVILATITLPPSSSTAIATSNIDNVTNRPVIVSTAILQAQLINCCCGQQNPPPPPSVSLSQIQVRQSANPATGVSAGPWGISEPIGNQAPANFDYQLSLTGPSTSDFQVNVTQDAASENDGFEVTFRAAQPVVIPAGQTTQIFTGNSVNFTSVSGQTINLTATAADNPSNSVGPASLTIPPTAQQQPK